NAKTLVLVGYDVSLRAETIWFLKRVKPEGWSQVNIQTGTGPGPRISPAVYASPTYGEFLFGGYSPDTGQYPEDTWAFSLGGLLWTHFAATLFPPAGRTEAAAQYYPIGPGGVMYGGWTPGGITLDDTWVLPDRLPVGVSLPARRPELSGRVIVRSPLTTGPA